MLRRRFLIALPFPSDDRLDSSDFHDSINSFRIEIPFKFSVHIHGHPPIAIDAIIFFMEMDDLFENFFIQFLVFGGLTI